MGRYIFSLALTVSVCAVALGSPHAETYTFLRSAVETVPPHEPIATPIRASVESIPLRSLGEEDEGRLPLRDAVERRPISTPDKETLYRLISLDVDEEDPVADVENFGVLRDYYGAASHFNRNNERLQQGNANLQAMQQTATEPEGRRLVVCYMESWAAYRSPPLAFTAGLVPRTCTHLHYAFAAIHPHTFKIMPANEDYDIIKGGYRIATGLKHRLDGLRVMLSVGGVGSDRLFSDMVEEPMRRRAFVDSAVDFLREHEFDGLDLHWVYAGEIRDQEKDQLTALLYELREKFSSYGLLLSTVLPPFRYQIDDGYDISAVSGASDYAILQAWDMTHGSRNVPPPKAFQHSALHRDPGATSRDQRYDNIEFMVKYILRRGMAADKLVLGVPLFGRSFTLAASTLPAPGALVNGWGEEGMYTQQKGLLSYFEICMAERDGQGASGIDEAGNAYAIFGNQWVSYDSPSIIVEKMKFVLSSGLAGAAAWAIDMDDFRGLCGPPFPIISAISTSLNGEAVHTDQSSLKIGPCDSERPYLASDEESCAHFHFCSGRTNYKLQCEDERLYDPSTGFCGHQDATKCMPGQSLRIGVDEAARILANVYGSDIEWTGDSKKDMTSDQQSDRLIDASSEVKKSKGNDKRVVCYMTSWAFYRRGDGKFVPEHVDTRLCTHVVYAYASLSPNDLTAKEFDPWADVTNNLYERVTSLNDVKVLLGLGGWTDSAGDKYSRLVSSSSSRTNFIKKLIPFLRSHNFQGLHLDWNYPVCWQSNCKKGAASDKTNYAVFVKELSQALHAADMELGIAVSGYKEVIESAYDLPALSKSADFLSAMTYDYHGGWERTTAHHTPLVPPPKDSLAYYSIEYAIKALLSGGADPQKLLLGLSFYGQSYRLAEPEGTNGPGSPASGPGEAGEFTKQPGLLSYYEICYRVKNLRWKTGRQTNAGPYAYSENQWVGYDDPESITEKVRWALKQGLGGVTAWAIDMDDFNNRCCAEPSPLLRAAGRALGRSAPPRPPGACERPPQPVTPAPPTTTTVAADGSGGGDHGSHGGHGDHSSTTWPSWSPEATSPSTAHTWWPQPTTTSTTTTTKRPTTSKRPAATTARPTIDAGSIEGSSCVPGEFHAAPGDCEAYLQCEGGQWRKHRCAPGLHWYATAGRCDWPSFAKCSVTSSSEASTATSTLAPTASRPPPTPPKRPATTTTTTRKPTITTTTTRKPTTTTTTTTTTTRKPTTTTTTTTTRKPTTTTISSVVAADGMSEGDECSVAQEYTHVEGDCNSYLHCDGSFWLKQRCAPGLHWIQDKKHCDWPKYSKCGSSLKPSTTAPRPSKPSKPIRPATTTPSSNKAVEDGPCGSSDSHASASTCDSYLMCVSGRWRKQLCPPGLHWDRRTNRCDWVEFAMCETSKPSAPKLPPMEASSTTRPSKPKPTTSKPVNEDVEILQQGMSCNTGTYHAHSRCDKFFVCVNGALVTQSCAPGLVWNAPKFQCDFPSATSCSDRRQTGVGADGKPDSMMMQLTTFCENGEYAVFPSDCTRYRHCLFGKFEEFSCAAGLHWNKEKQICDWPKSAKCKKKATSSKPTQSKPILGAPSKPQYDQDADISRPVSATTKKPATSAPATTSLPLEDYKPDHSKSQYKLVCYYTNWAWYRPGLGKYGPEDIDPSLCTHIIYGFAVLGNDSLITAHDTWADIDNRFYERVVEYKRRGVKVSLALGGWNDSAGDKYSKLVNSPSARAKFVTHAVEFLEKYNFDGLDLDWEYPKCWQVDCSKGPDSDKRGFSSLVKELSAVLKPKGLLLSSAVSPNKRVIDAGYDVPLLAKYLDWIAVMTYDYHGQWDKKTGHVAPLYYHPKDDNTYFNANYTMHYWMKKGAPPSKLIMGMPMYGQSFTIGAEWDTSSELAAGKHATGLNVPAQAGGEAGEYTRAKGFIAYYEICDRIKNRGWTVVKDPLGRMGPFAFKGNQWVSFDDLEIIKKKVNFIKSLGLAGGMIWALDLDDFRNRCGQGKHPLLRAIKNGFSDPHITADPAISQSMIESPSNTNDLDDIEVRPGYTKKPTTPRPVKQTTPVHPMHTTKKPSTSITDISPVVTKEERFKVVCYYTNWAWYRPGPGKYSPSDVDASLCTHIVYAFAVLDAKKLIIKPHDTWLDVENKFYEKVVAMKTKGVKVLLGLGGWKDSAGDKYSRLVNSPSARRTFVVHAVDFIDQYGFDGLDLDWEYPKCWQVECEKGPTSDKQGFANLVKELRAAFTSRNLLLSAAVSPSKRVIDAGYDVPVLSKYLDWIAVMTYDYHGQWDKKTGHVAPMYLSDEDDDRTFNANFTIHYWMQKGASARKLVMGVPMYGQSFSLVEDSGTGLGVPTYAGGEAGDETRARGFLSFYEICERVRIRGWKVNRDPGGRMGPYATLNDQWVSFDDDVMIRHKSEYIRAMGLGGGMVWAMDLDDFAGSYCGCGKYPLLMNINHVLRGKEAPPLCPLEEILDPESDSTAVIAGIPSPTTDSQEENIKPMIDVVSETKPTDGTLEGTKCSGFTFMADPDNCSKYYLCNNGDYMGLQCPSPLHWNKNHCDWPSKSSCRNKALLRLTADSENKDELIDDKPIIACYFTNWAYYRQGKGSYGPEQVDASLCTHIVYTWAHLDPDSFELMPGNPEIDVENDFYGKMTELRLKGIKVIIGAGGLEDSEEEKWDKMAVDPENRKTFIESVLKFIKRWNFDGIQIAWQYPVCKQTPCYPTDTTERDNFSSLIMELASAMRPLGMELSALVSANPEIAHLAYDARVLSATVDWLAVAANDYYASTSGRTAFLIALDNADENEVSSFNSTLAYWSTMVPTSQLVVGVPSYARSYSLRDTSSFKPGAAVTGPGEPGPFTAVPGFLAYYEVCTGDKANSWTETSTEDGSYSVSGSQWASNLSPAQAHRIAASVRRAGGGGVALWALDLDDWRGDCGCAPYPMLQALRQGLLNPASTPTSC